jgi:chemotaxis signal transduction protein
MAQALVPQSVQRRHLVVRSGSVRCALPARAVRRIVRGLPVTPVPGGERRLRGLAQFGGEPLVVLDLLALLGTGEEEQAGTLEVTVVAVAGPGAAAEVVGLAVDEALEVVALDPDTVTAIGEGLVRGEVLLDEHVVRVLDLEALGGER